MLNQRNDENAETNSQIESHNSLVRRYDHQHHQDNCQSCLQSLPFRQEHTSPTPTTGIQNKANIPFPTSLALSYFLSTAPRPHFQLHSGGFPAQTLTLIGKETAIHSSVLPGNPRDRSLMATFMVG